MGIKNIFISNVLEGYYQTYLSLPEKEKKYWIKHDFREANRAFFYGSDNKAIVTSYPINSAHFAYIKNLVGWKNVVNLYPKNPTPSICNDLVSGKAGEELVKIIKENPGLKIIAYRNSPEFFNLIESLRTKNLEFKTPESVTKEDQFIVRYAGSKRGFRHLWSVALVGKEYEKKLAIPYGFITKDKVEAIEAGYWFRKRNRSFVVKYNFGVSGVGLIMFKKDFLPKDYVSFKKYLERQMKDEIWNEPLTIIEEMIDVDTNLFSGSPNVELCIDEEGGVRRSYSCEQVLDSDGKTFLGIYINPEVTNSDYMKVGFEAGEIFGYELAKLGYRGIFDIDFVISKEGKLYAVESNLRRTGGTHTHEFCQSLLGEEYFYNYNVLSEDIHLKEKLKYQDFMSKFGDYKYNPNKKEGFILFNADMLEVNIVSIMYIAKNKDHLEKIRSYIKTII